MNKVYGDSKDGKVLVLILEPGNIHKLVEERKPIEIKLHEGPWERGLPAKLTLTILYSETPVADARALEKSLKIEIQDTRTPMLKTSRPHCPECRSVLEQMGVLQNDKVPVWLVFCPVCGCALGATPPVPGLERA